MADVGGLLLVEPAGDVGPVADVVGARRCRAGSVQPDTCRATYPSPLPSAASPAASTSTGAAATSTSQKPFRTASAVCCSARLDAGSSRRGIVPSTRVHHVERRADHRLVVAVARPSRGTSGNTGASAAWIRCSRPMSWAPFAFTPAGGRRRISVAAGLARAGRSGWRRRPGTAAPRASRRAVAPRLVAWSRSHSATAVDVEGVLVADRPALVAVAHGQLRAAGRPGARITASYAARSASFSAYAARAAGSGRISSSPRSMPRQHRGRDLVGAERRRLDQPADHRAERRVGALHRGRPGRCGSTTGTPRSRARRTPRARGRSSR